MPQLHHAQQRHRADGDHGEAGDRLRGLDQAPRIDAVVNYESEPGFDEDTFRAWLWKCDIGGTDTGLLAGKRVSFKDHISVARIPQVFTTQAMEGFIPDVDATVVTRVLAAGGRVIGKHMMNGFVGDYGAPVNPHNPAHATGGSSSGSGAALAAGEVDISFGGDQGGSVRLPAAHCGLVGLKPTYGLVSHFGAGFGAAGW